VWHTGLLSLVVVITLSWLLAGVGVLALLNIAKWHLGRSIDDTAALAGPPEHSGSKVSPRFDTNDEAEISRSVARHPAGTGRGQLAVGAR
jgi:hypothetical protein